MYVPFQLHLFFVVVVLAGIAHIEIHSNMHSSVRNYKDFPKYLETLRGRIEKP